jgi:LemA protein
MKKSIWIIVIAIVAILAIGVGQYNGLVSSQEAVEGQLSNIQVQLQRRSDLIPNLVNTVKAYAKHETEVYESIADARAKMTGATTPDELVEADGELTQALGRLFAVAEAYPQLNSNENFLSLQDQLEGTENRISTARRDYNEAAKSYNIKIRRFPTNLFAGILGFEKYELFQANAEAQDAPTVNFD